MAKINETTVIDLTDNPKTAALYFDYVLPLGMYDFVENAFRISVPDEMLSMLPLRMQDEEGCLRGYSEIAQYIATCMCKRINAEPVDLIPHFPYSS